MKRPVLVSIVCIVQAIFFLLGIASLFFPGAIVGSERIVVAVGCILGIISMVGLWMMKRWGIVLYAVLIIAGYLVSYILFNYRVTVVSLVFPLIVLLVGFLYFKKLSWR